MPSLSLAFNAAVSAAVAALSLGGPARGQDAAPPAGVEVAYPRLTAAFPDLSDTGEPVFPLPGPHRMGTLADQRFGGARGHLGQDILADCGERVVAAREGRVVRADYEGGAGNMVVVAAPDARANVYMHLLAPARVRVGDRVTAGAALGRVGATGDADGCHLHFEQWTAPGWFRGAAVDPYAELRRWEAAATVRREPPARLLP